jgi:hypothetical protein
MSHRTVKISIVSAAILLSAAVTGDRAFANPFGFINDTLKSVNQTVESVSNTQKNVNSTQDNLRGFLGLPAGESKNGGATGMGGTTSLGPTEGMAASGSAKPAQGDNGGSLFGVYADWHQSLPANGKKVLGWLVSKYAEDNAVNFKTFKGSDIYKKLSASDKSQADALFFKFNEVMKVAAPQKDKFLSFAFCLNSGSKTCK